MQHEPKTEQVVIRVTPALRQRLEAAAQLDRRPLGQLVRNVLADYVAEQKEPA